METWMEGLNNGKTLRKTYSFALERLGSDSLDWDPCRHGPPIGRVGVLQDTVKREK